MPKASIEGITVGCPVCVVVSLHVHNLLHLLLSSVVGVWSLGMSCIAVVVLTNSVISALPSLGNDSYMIAPRTHH